MILFVTACFHHLLPLITTTVTANFFILRNYEMEDEIICFVIFMIDNYRISYIIAARETILVEPLSSRTKHLILIIIVQDEMYYLALINTSRAG
jgi:hypothetical protein